MGTDLITLEVLRNKFDVIADEMEIALLKSAYSSIVKEGMDASAALFTVHGETIAQAASIPIHLGSLVPVVQRIMQEFPVETMQEGDVYIMNDPYDGGSHLPRPARESLVQLDGLSAVPPPNWRGQLAVRSTSRRYKGCSREGVTEQYWSLESCRQKHWICSGISNGGCCG